MPQDITKIPRCQKGGESAVSANYFNQVIDAVNMVLSARIAPIANFAVIKFSGGFMVYDYTLADQRLKTLEQAVLGFDQNSESLESRVANIEARLNSATINASGNCTGNNIEINISMNI